MTDAQFFSNNSIDSEANHAKCKQEAQLMLANLRDAFIGQSRSPNIVPLHIFGIV